MNFSRANTSAPIHIGCVWGSRCLDVTKAITDGLVDFSKAVSTLDDVIGSDKGLRGLEEQLKKLQGSTRNVDACLFDEASVTLEAPVKRAQKVIGIGLNYKDHSEETKFTLPKAPLLFGMYANAIIGPNSPILIPPSTTQVDYEAELGVVIGDRARRVSPEAAVGFVAGYTIFNDVSARDMQFGDKQWTRGKSIDTFAPMGPYLVTPETLGSADNLDIELRLNGQTLQKSNTRHMIFNVPALVSYISQTMTLEPGDVIATGTPSGVGYVRVPPIFMKHGDTVEIEIQGLGVLRNPVRDSD